MPFAVDVDDGEVFDHWYFDHFKNLPKGRYRCADPVLERKKRTLPQNNLFHAWMSQLERESHAGYRAEEWKEVFRQFFLIKSKKRNPLDRRKWVTEYKSTADLDTKEFNELLEKVRISALTKSVWPLKLEYPEDPFFADLINNPPPVSIRGFPT